MALAKISIDTAPANVLAMLAAGSFHSHQDGKWRFSPYGGETVYCDDPTEQFPIRCELGAICGNLFSHVFSDGTRGLYVYDEKGLAVLWQIYGPTSEHERSFRAWLLANIR